MRQPLLNALALATTAFAAPALAQSVPDTYGDDWYRGFFWSGEYPAGFSVLKDTVVKLRPTLSAKAEKSIDCPLPAKATYQTWNIERANNDGLAFVSFTKIAEMKVEKAYEAQLYSELDGSEQTLSFKPGDTWNYLAYYGEGAFLMEKDGVKYTGDMGLEEVSKPVDPEGSKGYDEWLRINCSNNQWGWLFFPDIVQDDVTFTGPNIVEYGHAEDLK